MTLVNRNSVRKVNFVVWAVFFFIFWGKRIHGFDLLGDRQLFIECESHGNLLCY